MRCKACNVQLDSKEMDEGICRKCIGKSKSQYIYTRDRTYEHEDLTERAQLFIDIEPGIH